MISIEGGLGRACIEVQGRVLRQFVKTGVRAVLQNTSLARSRLRRSGVRRPRPLPIGGRGTPQHAVLRAEILLAREQHLVSA